MALTRKALAAMGIEEAKIDQIIEMHTETTDALKAARDSYKAGAEKLPGVQKELDDLKAEAAKNSGDTFKIKYEAIKQEYEDYKKEITEKASRSAKESAYRKLLESVKLSSKIIDKVVQISGDTIDKIELDEDGKVKDADKITASVKEDWADFIPTTQEKGATTPTPPAGDGGGVASKADIYKRDEKGRYVMDASQRQAALAKLIESEKE